MSYNCAFFDFFSNNRKGKLYLVFEFVEKTMLEILEERTTGLQGAQVRTYIF